TNGVFQTSTDGINWISATTFTSTDLNLVHVRFVHNGGEAAPTFSVSVNDGVASSATVAGSVSFINSNDAPTVAAASLTLSEGSTTVLTAGNFTINDPDNSAFTFTLS